MPRRIRTVHNGSLLQRRWGRELLNCPGLSVPAARARPALDRPRKIEATNDIQMRQMSMKRERRKRTLGLDRKWGGGKEFFD